MALLLLIAGGAQGAAHYPVFAAWPQADGPGTPLTLTYSFSNLFDGSLRQARNGETLAESDLRAAFTAALEDYAAVLPIDFVEVADNAGPLPESGEYDPQGFAQIRIGQVAHIEDANAYAYFPMATDTSGLAGDIVFNAARFGAGWTLSLFYAVAQHEMGHVLGLGHFVDAGQASDDLQQSAAYPGPLFPLDPLAVRTLQQVYGVGSGSVTPIPVTAPGLLLGSAMLALLSAARRRQLPSPTRSRRRR
ncbi:MAG: matrixin family metalloprotease [Polyangiaceae bacterium]